MNLLSVPAIKILCANSLSSACAPYSHVQANVVRIPLHGHAIAESVTCVNLMCRNVMDVSAYALQIVIVIMHLSRAGVDSNELSVFMAIQVLVLWIKVQYYAR